MFAPTQDGAQVASVNLDPAVDDFVESAEFTNRNSAFDETSAEIPNEVRKHKAIFENCVYKPIPLWKRCFDIIAALFLLVLLSPVLLLISLFIRITSGGPVFFRQPRLGLMGQEFIIVKFRTLKCCPNATDNHREFVNNQSANGTAIAKPDLTKRLIPGGNFLRRTSLDELPQLLNILRGEMSLIGPRPDVLRWEDYKPFQLRRFSVHPGVTGLWQVSGKNKLTFQEMIDRDIEYVENRSALLDLRIAFKTMLMLLFRQNA